MPASDADTEFVARVRETIARYDLLPRGAEAAPEPVVVGVSGGPDSVALAHVLAHLAEAGEVAAAPVVAHLHHGLRGEAADRDARLVADLADRLHLPYVAGRADIRAEADAAGVGVEEAGRDARRRFFRQTARRRGAAKVALGHHGGDRVETVLFHILRGTGIDGLAALGPRAWLPSPSTEEGGRDGGHRHPPSGGHGSQRAPWPRERGHATPPGQAEAAIEIVRPMIHPAIDRDRVLAYLERTGLTWRRDETNADTAYTRNRLRHEVLPMLAEAVNPAVAEALLRLADQAEAARAVLDDALDRAWAAIVREVPGDDVISTEPQAPNVISTEPSRSEGERSAVPRVPAGNLVVGERKDKRPRRDASGPQAGPQNDSAGGGPRALLIDADDFAALRPWLQGAIVRRAVEHLGGGLKHMSAARTEEVVSALVAKTVAGPVDLPDGLVAERRRRAIRIGPGRERPERV